MRDLSTTLLLSALLLLSLAIWAETANSKVWNSRLVFPDLITEPRRHTPQHTTGTFLPSSIAQDLTLTPADNPILLTATTRIAPRVTLTLSPGTTVYAHEFAGLTVLGQLIIGSPSNQPVLLTSNELHPLNQTWSGITVTEGGGATITNAVFRYASPALTCLPGSQATLTNSHITNTALGVFTASPPCRLNHSRINSTRDGLVAIDTKPQILDTTINARHSTY